MSFLHGLKVITRVDVRMFAHGDDDQRTVSRRETPSATNGDGVVVLSAYESERRIVVGRRGIRIGMNEVVLRTTIVEVIDLVVITGRAEFEVPV